MTYTSKTQMVDAVGATTLLQLCDDPLVGDWTTGDADGRTATDRLNHCIAQAGRTIDGYAAVHFSVPFASPTPPMIAEIAVALCIFYCYRRRQDAFGVPEDVRLDYRDAMKRLDGINKGLLDPGVEPAPTASEQTVTQYSGPDRLFTNTTLKDFS